MFTLDRLIKFQKRRALQEAEEPESEPKERAVTVLMFAEGLGLTAAGVKVFVDTDWNKQ
jgi:hypothetical protein